MPSATQGLLLNPKVLIAQFGSKADAEAALLALYMVAYNLALQGKSVMDVEGEGNRWGFKFPLDVAVVLSEAGYALQQLNPATYGNILQKVQPYFI